MTYVWSCDIISAYCVIPKREQRADYSMTIITSPCPNKCFIIRKCTISGQGHLVWNPKPVTVTSIIKNWRDILGLCTTVRGFSVPVELAPTTCGSEGAMMPILWTRQLRSHSQDTRGSVWLWSLINSLVTRTIGNAADTGHATEILKSLGLMTLMLASGQQDASPHHDPAAAVAGGLPGSEPWQLPKLDSEVAECKQYGD